MPPRLFPPPWSTSQRERMLAYSRTGGSVGPTPNIAVVTPGTMGTRQSRRVADGFAV
jgi:hypothetical protein